MPIVQRRRPDLIVLDLMMPVLARRPGRAAARERALPHIPIVVMSANTYAAPKNAPSWAPRHAEQAVSELDELIAHVGQLIGHAAASKTGGAPTYGRRRAWERAY